MDHERGASSAEYGLLVSLIGVVIIVAVRFFGTQLADLLTFTWPG